MDDSTAKQINSFHRRLLRRVLNVKWPRVMTNVEVYNKTNTVCWSKNILRRRLTWLGHLLRLDRETPARKALKEACRDVKKVVGRHKRTWIELVRKDLDPEGRLSGVNDDQYFEQLSEVCADRVRWRKLVNYMMLNTTDM